MRVEEWDGEATISPGGDRSGEECWDGLDCSSGLGALRRRDSSSREAEEVRDPASGGLSVPCMSKCEDEDQ